ncbi:MAG: 23S rRNA (uracil(1939)-C(5))-methyltransferase RlmD [Castellaniella sp.]|uniref:23S rRNA (uracil(1939)-C(5))-methyltransferase RlmD n=1 Tax=Castellaniella sp. TaxID=1955812 RepID=UPI002A35C6E4|nr:23S rRNA (uracil(1939)-C(5))-methyltransferase RlmD [Castellaniella sp.]MDY0309177.1 23S rRNA (uracil(1939)-C(5))-methyltransferase RlmD [Castellaniella sp.]
MLLSLDVESLDLEGQGIAHHEGKVVFVEGALPGERVLARVTRRKPSFDKARTERVLRPSSQRTRPPCPHFGVCGGCAMQHLEPAAQMAVKQRALEDALAHIGKVRPEQILPAVQGPAFGYRHRARLSVRLVPKKGGMLVGFRERASSYVADMQTCLVLPPHVSALLMPLRDLIGGLSRPDRMPQVEVAVGDASTVFCLRHLEPLTPDDLDRLRDFGVRHGIDWWLQPKGPETAHPLDPERADALAYVLPAQGLRMHYRPTDFTQVNPYINQALVARALSLLDVQPDDRVADLFCGLGNFSLPLAMQGRAVVGIEGSATLVARAREDAARQGLQDRAEFTELNLFEVDAGWLRGLGRCDRMLIDPPREGALAVAQALSALAPDERPRRVVYVSCNPATLARDAGILHHVGGWSLKAVGAVNMFPHTAHVESIAVFEP